MDREDGLERRFEVVRLRLSGVEDFDLVLPAFDVKNGRTEESKKSALVPANSSHRTHSWKNSLNRFASIVALMTMIFSGVGSL
jgi:hypothetical protein